MDNLTIKADAAPLAQAVAEMMKLIGDGRGVHPYIERTVSAMLSDPVEAYEFVHEAGRAYLRPSPAFIAALATMRAIRGKAQPEAWKPAESQY